MKRSEMLKYLAKSLRRKDQCITTNMDQCRYLAKLMLDSAETAGMMPPDTLPASLSLTTKDWKVKREQYIMDRFKWEGEDEEK